MTGDSLPDEAPAASCRMLRNETAVIISIDDSIIEVLGWRPEQLIGSPSTGLIHPDDRASGVAAWLEMIATPGLSKTWRGRYRAADDSWRWVQSVNSNHLDDADNPHVLGVMTRITVNEMSIEEELQVRKQQLSRLAEALPVGVFQVDGDHRITFTNARLHEILGIPPAAEVATQFAVIVDDDKGLLDAGLQSALNDQPVDDLELRFRVDVPHPDFAATRVCQVSLRPLTDAVGTVTGAIGCLSDVTDSVELRRELQIRAEVDGLTGCLNRTATFELLDMHLRQPATPGSGLAVIFVDLDHFKSINDRFGHGAGDKALVLAAGRIREAVRTGDSVGRIGGDEFLVICPDVRNAEAALPVARRVNESLRHFLTFDEHEIQMGASVGVAWAIHGSESPDGLIARADSAMYASKLLGAGEVAVAT